MNGLAAGETLRRVSAWVLAAGVAAIAAIVSYSHIYDLGRAYGGSYAAARLLPLSVDLLILVGELMLLHESDARGRRFRPGWALVVSGIAATMAANVTFGAQFGAVGAVIWGWPAYSFVLVAYGMVAMVKRGGLPQDGAVPPSMVPEIATSVQEAAKMAYIASVRGGNPLSERAIADRFGVARSQARKLRAEVAAASNGGNEN
jgi:Protein of unknown function (DUF2637)